MYIRLLVTTCHYISDTRCLTSATPECNVRTETSVTVPSRLNAPIVLWRLNNLTLPARVGLKLSTWRLESVAGLLSTLLATAVYCPLRWRLHVNDGKCALFIRTFVSGGIVSMSQMSRIYRRRERRFTSLLFSSLYCHQGEKLSLKKRYKQCLGGLKCSQNAKKNKKRQKVSFKAIFKADFINFMSKEYFLYNVL